MQKCLRQLFFLRTKIFTFCKDENEQRQQTSIGNKYGRTCHKVSTERDPPPVTDGVLEVGDALQCC